MPSCPQCGSKVALSRASGVRSFKQLLDAGRIVDQFNSALEEVAEDRLEQGRSADSQVLRDTRRLQKKGRFLRNKWHAHLHKEYHGPLPFPSAIRYLKDVEALLRLYDDIVDHESPQSEIE